MKKLIYLLLISGLVFGGQATAQKNADKGNQKPDKTKVEKSNSKAEDKAETKPQQDKDKEKTGKTDETKVTGKDKEHPGKGHAYGKDKEGLEGKEFGQHRAAEAKTKKEAVEQADANINQATQTQSATRTKIKDAREKLEAKKKGGQIKDAEYAAKKKAIDDLEKELDALEKEKEAVKQQLDKENAVGN